MKWEDRLRAEQIEVQRVSPDGHQLEGFVLRWGRPYRVSDDKGKTFYWEQWRERAARRSIDMFDHRFELLHEHDQSRRVGTVEFNEVARGLQFHATISDDEPELVEQVRVGAKRGVSLRFAPEESTRVGERDGLPVEEIVRARLRELSLTATPQYDDARVEVQRADEAAKEAMARRRELIEATQAQMRRYESLRMEF